MKIAYFNCFSGISGDMCIGAIVDAGIPLEDIKKELKKIPIKGYSLNAKKVKRGGLSATKVDVVQRSGISTQQSVVRKWNDIKKITQNSSLSREMKQKGFKVFENLFEAEAKVHGEAFGRVHLHELGGIDCLIDVLGTIIGLDILGVKKIYSSPINLGGGSVKTKHGILPVPAPATTEILRGVPVYSTNLSSELTTPTGAAILKGLSAGFGDIPLMSLEKTGFGAGNKNFKNRPNVMGLFIGEEYSATGDHVDETAVVIEANIDDMNPQIYEYVMERLLKAGALDVFLTQVVMKKGRPGIILTVLCGKPYKEKLVEIIMRETATIGLRFYEVKRQVLKREIRLIDTEFGKIRIKFSRLGDEILKATPEYEDCKRIAKKLKLPLIEVMEKIKVHPSK